MARDRRVARVGQAELLQARAALASRRSSRCDLAGRSRRAARCSSSARVSSSRSVPPMSLLPRPLTVIGSGSSRGSAEQRLLGEPAGVDQAVPLQRHRACRSAAPASTRLDQLRQREVDVVAAEQQVIADRGALEAVAVGADVDQREVGGAAADVEHQHPLARAQPRAGVPLRGRSRRRTRPAAPRAGRPARSPARGGGLQGQLARGLVERRRAR